MGAAATDEKGHYQFINTRPGKYWVQCVTRERIVRHPAGGTDPAEESPSAKGWLEVRLGETVTDVDFEVASFERGRWRTLTFMDELPANSVLSIAQDKEGFLFLKASGLPSHSYPGKRRRRSLPG